LKDAAAGDWETAIALSLGNGLSTEDEHSWIQFQAISVISLLDLGCQDMPDVDAINLYGHLVTDYPRMGPAFAGGIGQCYGWDLPSSEAHIFPTDVEAPPMLVLNGLHDPATPYANAVALVEQLNNGSRLLSVEQEGHGVGGTESCALAAMRAYVESGDVSGAPASCAAEAQTQALRKLRELVLSRTSLLRLR
jgi:pimeloyl-ACP methyl ester carboxylesterase